MESDAMNADLLLENIRVLSSDAFEGRGPGTPAEERTIAFLIDQFSSLGLEPGHPDGGWTQPMTLVGLHTRTEVEIAVDEQAVPLVLPGDLVAATRRVTPEVDVVDSEIVFVGYGIVAPEFGWDDFKDVDVTGKTIVMLVNDPGYATGDPTVFRGRAMTYYGRWTYKYEIARDKGAAAAVIIHETGPAGYPWEVVTTSFGSENFDLVAADGNMSQVAVQSWIHRDAADRLFAAAGLSLDALLAMATRPDFRPVALGARATFRLRNGIREISSRNVVARLPGGHPQRREECIVYSAHWDHLGIGAADADGNTVYAGAHDNASGTAGLIELARAFAGLPQRPDRSILFLALTCEEKGLLGARHYASHPLYPLETTLANINIDGLNQWGRTRDIVLIGTGNTTLEEILAEEAARQGRRVAPDPEPEKGSYYRSDHFEFARQGVPALYTDTGVDYLDRPEGWGVRKRQEYTENDYHRPSDRIKDDWDLSGAIEDLQVLFQVGLRVAQTDAWPEWKHGTEFRARRLEMLGHRDEAQSPVSQPAQTTGG
jgi:Zn-dependent M28 family amino/carboxypeptidase